MPVGHGGHLIHFGVSVGGSGQAGTDDNSAWRPSFVCGMCGDQNTAAVLVRTTRDEPPQEWLRCTGCGRGAVVRGAAQWPGVPFGPVIQGLPDDVEAAYDEARECMSVNAYNAAELVCRKILMHVAVDRTDAKEGATFASYIDALEGSGFITPPMKVWVDLIRKNANDTTHKLASPDRSRAEGTVWFTAELLRIVYEMEHLVAKYAKPPMEAPAEDA